MSATISFTFPMNASYDTILAAIHLHFDRRGRDVDPADNPGSGARDAAEVFAGAHTTGQLSVEPTRSAAAVFTGQPQTSAAIVSHTTSDAVIRDAEGFPWDERIHSSNHQFTGKGLWTKRKGVADNTHHTVRAELMQRGLVVQSTQPAVTQPTAGITMAQSETSPDYLEKVARLNWATEQTMIQLGAYPGPVENFEKLKAGQMVTIAPHEADWFKRYTEQVHQLFNDNAPPVAAVTAVIAPQPAPYLAPTPAVQYTQPAMYTPPGAINAPSGQASAPVPATLDPNTYPGFAVFVSTAMQQGLLTLEQLNQTIAQAGVVDGVGLAAVGKHVEMIPAILALLDGFYQVRP